MRRVSNLSQTLCLELLQVQNLIFCVIYCCEIVELTHTETLPAAAAASEPL